MTGRAERRIETIATILLSIAALATSWSGYQATLWNGDQVEDGNVSIAMRAKSARQSNMAGQFVAIDVGLFNSWLTERTRGDARLAAFFETHFRPELKVAFDDWIKTDPFKTPTAAGTPFSLPSYHLASADSAQRYEQAADSAASLSSRANSVGDGYVLDAVIFATVMFFASTVQQSDNLGMRRFLLVLAGLACIGGLIRLFTLPRG